MKEFRVAKCLSDDGKRIRKHAIFKDGSRKKPIHEDEDGREYFEVDNWIDSDPELIEFNYRSRMADKMRLTFSGRISDAVESIRRGYGDVICVKNLPFGIRTEKVLYFLDREYGENIRQKSLEGWKNTVFKYTLTFNSIYVNIALKRSYYRSDDVFFNSVEEAKNAADIIIGDALEKCAYFVGKICPDADNNNEITKHIDRCIVSDLVSDQLALDILYLEEGQPIFLDPQKSSRKYIHSLFKIKQDVVPL